MDTLQQLEEQIATAMIADRFALRRQLRGLRKASRDGKEAERVREQFIERLERSQARRARRKAGRPAIEYDEQLPIFAHREQIQQAIEANPVVVICGETGSGKSTQLPKMCLEMGRGVAGLIGHTQPRRIAARSVAGRIAEELGSSLGAAVGFKIRFTDSTSPDTYVKLMTDGILLAETRGDRFLDQYDTLIVDEAHERSLNIDFLLGYVKRLLPKRPDLRLIITSATIDAERFAEHFGEQEPAPVLEVSGRTYPVEVRYRPLSGEEDDEQRDPHQAILDAVDELSQEGRGDILVFLPTERDIREAARRLRGHVVRRGDQTTDILPLYARLSTAEQNRVFQTHKRRRIVLATNVAESSLTVPGIRYVIDLGTARMSRYSPRLKVQRLPIEAVSQASANQRSGRCGRVAPGICLRLYAEDDYLQRDAFTTPEIRRTNLAAVILQTKSLQLGALESFPFLDPPHPDAIRDGYRTLFELGAIDDQRELTETGQQLARLPTDPRIARMILAADEQGCLDDVLIIAAALEIQDPRDRPVDKQQAADQAHAKWADEESDFLTLLNLWDLYEGWKADLSRNQLRKACKQNFVSYNRMREWQDVYRQLRRLVEQSGRKVRGRGKDYEAIHKALLTGLLANVALRGDTNEYTGGGGKKFFLWPGSVAAKKRPLWVVSAELLETTRRYARTVARVNPQWIEPIAEHLLKYSYSDPHWHPKSGSAMAFERVSLFGLPLVPRRRAAYGMIDPELSRDLLIREGLVAGQIGWEPPFLRHNQQLRATIEALAAKSRSRDLLVDEYRLIRFYDKRLPETAVDVARLRKWWRTASRKDPKLLEMSEQDLLSEPAEVTDEQFPESLQLEGMNLPLNYEFEPGSQEDGLTLTVPREAIGRLSSGQLGWLVPGLVEQKVLALIRCLPKSIRRNLVPAPDTARQVTQQLSYGQGEFLEEVCKQLSGIAEEPVRPSDFRLAKLPPHLEINVRVVAADGEELACGRDLGEIRDQFGEQRPGAVAEIADPQWHQDQLRTWDFGPLPKRIEVARNQLMVPAFPALVDQQDSVGIRLLDAPDKARVQTRRGIRRLCVLANARELREQVEWIPDRQRWEVMIAPVCPPETFRDGLQVLLADRAFLWSRDLPRDADAFQQCLKQGVSRIGSAVQEVTRLAGGMCEGYQRIRLELERAKAPQWRELAADLTEQLAELVEPGFLCVTPWQWLSHYPRYLQAMALRVDKLRSGSLARDQAAMHQLEPLVAACRERLQQHNERGLYDPELELFRWMLEEFRVSLFAQELGTSLSVSQKRLEKQWNKVQ